MQTPPLPGIRWYIIDSPIFSTASIRKGLPCPQQATTIRANVRESALWETKSVRVPGSV